MKTLDIKSSKISIQLLFIIICIGSQAILYSHIDTNTVAHKNLQLDLYLDLIRFNTHEKMGILPYMLQEKTGTYLEIGTGGDPLAEMLPRIPESYDITLIASDIDEKILESLPVRHPHLKKYLDAETGPRLHLQPLNATDMNLFDDSSLNGINASALLHEIISYSGGFRGMEQFFKEVFRTLKIGGVLIYRDPENIRYKDQLVTVNLKTKALKLFAHIFLYKFLDECGSLLAKADRKIYLYSTQDCIIHCYKRNEIQPLILSYQEYLEVPSYDIDFTRKFSLTIPRGLYRELARHYLTYLHQCNPLLFIKCIPDISSIIL